MPATRIKSKRHARSRHYAIRIGLVLVITADTLRRMLYGSRPIDKYTLAIGIVTLLIIGAEAIIHLWRYFRIERRKKQVLNYFIQGQALQGSPIAYENAVNIEPWREQLKTWIMTTSEFLRGCSPEACAAFLYDDAKVRDVHMQFQGVSPFVYQEFATLQQRLTNLRDILENPDVYL
ncbi:hypothetical protein [Candidatus Binatus sp.]|uniref:hypothetical protein n=1 Tax=Candidatus Binatus sp. TaxID=2811406 RepID=UPI003C921056